MHTPEDLEALLRPPVPAADYGRLSPGLQGTIDIHWKLSLFAAILKSKGRQVHFDEILLQGDPIKISQAVTAVRRARAHANDVFDRSTHGLWRLTIPKDEEQRRHFPASVLSRDEICDRTVRGPSLFFSGIRTEQLELVMYDLLELRFYEVVTEQQKPAHQKLDIDACAVIGCSRGRETSAIRFDLQFPAGVAHAYPVPLEDADLRLKDDDGRRYCSSDILQGYAVSP